MKVLHLRSGGGLYGAERVILALARGAGEAGHSAAVMNLQRPGEDEGLVDAARALGLESRTIACGSRLSLSALDAVARYLRTRPVDVVHSHDYKSDFYAYSAARASRTSVRLVATCHNWASDAPAMRLYKAVDKLVMRRFARVAAVSEPLRRELLSAGVDAGRLVNIPNGVRIDEPVPAEAALRLRESLGIGAAEKVVLAVGRLSPEKGHADLLAAARLVVAARPHCRFLIAGDGPLRLSLEANALSTGLGGHVRFLGIRSDVRELLAASDLFVLPSLKEGLPLALLEAMAAGKPVIAAPVGEIPTVVAHAVSGLLVEPMDTRAFSASIIRLLDRPEEAAALAAQGGRRVREGYSVAGMVRRYLELYQEALAS